MTNTMVNGSKIQASDSKIKENALLSVEGIVLSLSEKLFATLLKSPDVDQ